jgi:hypothetical protein
MVEVGVVDMDNEEMVVEMDNEDMDMDMDNEEMDVEKVVDMDMDTDMEKNFLLDDHNASLYYILILN